MLQAMLAGVASIKAQQTRMNVIGNNLANINTTAYKGSRVTFQDMLAQTIRGAARPTANIGGTNPIQFGLGVLVAGTDINGEQGSLNATNRPTDMAVQGNGYFMTTDGDRIGYTRDGAFDLDAVGDLVHRATGERVLGWDFVKQTNQLTTDPLSPQSTLNIPLGRLNAVQATGSVSFAGNLSGHTTAGSTAATPDLSTSTPVYDSQGGLHKITIKYFNRVAGATDSWDWQAVDSTGNVIGASAAGPPDTRMYFDMNGNPTAASNSAVRSATLAVGGSVGNLTFNLDFDQITQLKTGTATAPESQVGVENQDGFPPGSLQGFSVGTDGIITGLFTNGLTRPLGSMAMSIFPNPGGLERMGSNLWRNTDNSGIPVMGTPRTGGRGQINSGFLEQSNVDIGSEFTDLIITQRGFQANTKVVTTVDEMLQDLINMKR